MVRKFLFIILLFAISTNTSLGQNYYEWDNYGVDYFYKKIDLDYGTLDEDGDDIDYIFVRTEIDEGVYEVEISSDDGDLYLIEGTGYYLEFTLYYGYASYDEGILKANSYGGGTFYVKNSY